jgi:nicotinamide-nucleotide amidase
LLGDGEDGACFGRFPAGGLLDPCIVLAELHRRLLEKRWQFALAESCTGGLIAATLTEFPGSSRYLYGGWVVYSNHAKYDWLEVSPYDLEGSGAVSEPVVRGLLQGIFTRSPARLAMAVSGVAGPDGGSAAKPVGTVWCGVAERGGQALVRRFQFDGDRQGVRSGAACACGLMLLELLKLQEISIDTGYKL